MKILNYLISIFSLCVIHIFIFRKLAITLHTDLFLSNITFMSIYNISMFSNEYIGISIASKDISFCSTLQLKFYTVQVDITFQETTKLLIFSHIGNLKTLGIVPRKIHRDLLQHEVHHCQVYVRISIPKLDLNVCLSFNG